jgi:hypothetical protein
MDILALIKRGTLACPEKLHRLILLSQGRATGLGTSRGEGHPTDSTHFLKTILWCVCFNSIITSKFAHCVVTQIINYA